MRSSDETALTLRLTATAGLTGAFVLLAANFFLYAHPTELSNVVESLRVILKARASILGATATHLLISNLLCPIAAVLYVAGGWHVYARFRTALPRWAMAAGALFALLAVMSCAYHALFSQYAFALQFVNANSNPSLHPSLDPSLKLLDGASSHMRMTLSAATFVGAPLILLMSIPILWGRTTYPRWSVILNPFLTYAVVAPLLTPFANGLASPGGALMLSSLSEIAMVIFFVMSLTTLKR